MADNNYFEYDTRTINDIQKQWSDTMSVNVDVY